MDCIYQSVEIDDTSFRPSIYLDFYRFHRYIESVHQKMKTEFMQTVNLFTIELQLRFEGSNNYHLLKNLEKNLISSLKSSDG